MPLRAISVPVWRAMGLDMLTIPYCEHTHRALRRQSPIHTMCRPDVVCPGTYTLSRDACAARDLAPAKTARCPSGRCRRRVRGGLSLSLSRRGQQVFSKKASANSPAIGRRPTPRPIVLAADHPPATCAARKMLAPARAKAPSRWHQTALRCSDKGEQACLGPKGAIVFPR